MYYFSLKKRQDVQNKDLMNDNESAIQRSAEVVVQAEATENTKKTVKRYVLL